MLPRIIFPELLNRMTVFIVGLACILATVGCGGGGGGTPLPQEENVTISGKVDDGTANSPIPGAICRLIDQNGAAYTANSNAKGEYLLIVPPEVEGNIRCYPSGIPNLALSNFMSTRDREAGDRISGEDVTPARTVVADIIDSENPPVPQARKLELLDDINSGRDPDLSLVVLLSTQLYKSMLKRNIDVSFGGGEGGGSGGGGAGGAAGDGGDGSPIVNARCEFIVGNNLKEGTVLNHAALADFLDDGMINRPDLIMVMEDLNPVVQDHQPEEIKAAFSSVFKMGLGNPYFDTTDENGEYFIEIPPNVPGYVRCYPPNQENLVLATYVPGRQKDQSLLDQDVTPATTFFSHRIASELSEDLSTVKENYLNDYSGLMDVHIIKVGDTVTGFGLQTDSDPKNKDVGLVAFSATSLFNILYKNGVNFDYLGALDDLVKQQFVDSNFLETIGIPPVQAVAWSTTVNTSNEAAATVLGTGMASALSRARINVTVSDTSGVISGATVDVTTDIACVSGCGRTTDAFGELTLTLSDVPPDAIDIIVEASAAGFQPTAVTTRVAAFSTVDVAIVFTSTAPPCTYSILPTSRSFTSSVGTGTIDVVANSGCTWSASEVASWITITSGGSGSGNGTVTYSVSANPSTSPRTATITAAGRSHTVTQAANALPDLVITTGSPTVTPSTVAPGGTVTLSAWTVRNQGTAASGGFSNGFYLSTDAIIGASDTYLDGNSNTSLAAGAQFAWGGPTLTIPAGTLPGTYYVGILVDRANESAESNESNNYVSRQITVTALPDIRPTISNIRQELVSPTFTCVTASGSTFTGFYYRITVNYQDPNGDVTMADGAKVRLDGSDFQWFGISGDGFSGTASADPCYPSAQHGRPFSMAVFDGAGLESNSLTITIP